MKQTYTLNVAGLQRELPLCPISKTMDIAAFIMLSDVELTVACAKELAARLPEVDVLLTAECKGIPLAYEMARQMGIPYVTARKSVKLYMQNPICVTVQSITTANAQKLYIDEDAVESLRGKRVAIVDDVISTGESLTALVKLVEAAGGNLTAQCAVLAEGDAAKRDDILFLAPLPLFPHPEA